jgi:hypothetical protein
MSTNSSNRNQRESKNPSSFNNKRNLGLFAYDLLDKVNTNRDEMNVRLKTFELDKELQVRELNTKNILKQNKENL